MPDCFSSSGLHPQRRTLNENKYAHRKRIILQGSQNAFSAWNAVLSWINFDRHANRTSRRLENTFRDVM